MPFGITPGSTEDSWKAEHSDSHVDNLISNTN